jgi:predicted nucleic acid-binding protein
MGRPFRKPRILKIDPRYVESSPGSVGRPASHRARAEPKLSAFAARAPILPRSNAVARRCAQLRHILHRQGGRGDRRALDLITAATALEHGLILVSRNLEDFRDIPGPRLYEHAPRAEDNSATVTATQL